MKFGAPATTSNFLDSIVGLHANLDISEELFDSFQRTLIYSVIEYNDEFNDKL